MWNWLSRMVYSSETWVLEMKSISITRLKLWCVNLWMRSDWTCKNLKWKASRLRDWNCSMRTQSVFRTTQKLEMKSISITRLKQSKWVRWRLSLHRIPLEMKSISITRLKLENSTFSCTTRIASELLKWKASRLRDWNGNIHWRNWVAWTFVLSWNEKHLDYEIETTKILKLHSCAIRHRLEMKSISITRLKL